MTNMGDDGDGEKDMDRGYRDSGIVDRGRWRGTVDGPRALWRLGRQCKEGPRWREHSGNGADNARCGGTGTAHRAGCGPACCSCRAPHRDDGDRVRARGRAIDHPQARRGYGSGGLLKVSRQRVSALAKTEYFPAPLARLSSGPVWDRTSLTHFLEAWDRTPRRKPG